MKITSIFCFMFCLVAVSIGQIQENHFHLEDEQKIRCFTDESYEYLLNENPEYKKDRKEIEQKIQEFIANRDVIDGIITIPVVYHVIHNGDPIGSGENLAESLLLAQIEQMNDDFRRMNSDAGNTPSDFVGVAADTEIEFCLTSMDEAGNSHSGINRINISTLSGVSESDCWTQSYINSNIKIPTVWDNIDILNIWTTVKIEDFDVTCNGGILGYAQFPGMAANTDGIVLRSTTVGSIANPNPNGGPFAIGRTGTHEVGHYLDLYHIFQGAGCGTDMVADTPTHNGPNYTGSPCTYPGPNSCTDSGTDFPDMFMNYMDYSDDTCMNLFTQGQKSRMIAAINVSRPGLLTAQCGPTCGDYLLVNDVLDGNYYADISITSVGPTSIPFSNDVELRSGDIVILDDGFDVVYGGGLYVGYGDCSSTFTSDNDESKRSINDQAVASDRGMINVTIPSRRSKTPQEIEELNEMINIDRNRNTFSSNKSEIMQPQSQEEREESERKEYERMVRRDRSIK